MSRCVAVDILFSFLLVKKMTPRPPSLTVLRVTRHYTVRLATLSGWRMILTAAAAAEKSYRPTASFDSNTVATSITTAEGAGTAGELVQGIARAGLQQQL